MTTKTIEKEEFLNVSQQLQKDLQQPSFQVLYK